MGNIRPEVPKRFCCFLLVFERKNRGMSTNVFFFWSSKKLLKEKRSDCCTSSQQVGCHPNKMYAAARTRQDVRRKGFKKGLDAEESRRRRVEDHVKVRKDKREELALKRRNINLQEDEGSASMAEEGYDLGDLIQMVFSDNEEAIFHGTQSIRKILSQATKPPLDKVIRSNVIPRLVDLLACPNSDIQFEAAWALTNVASGTSKHTKAVLDSNAVPAFVKMSATSEKIENKEQATWALGNIAGDSSDYRDYVLSCNALGPLLATLSHTNNKSFLRNGTWTLSNLVRGKPAPDFELISGALGPLYRLLHMEDEEILGDACWALSYITDGEDERIEAVVKAGLVPRLVNLMKSTNQSIVTPCLRAVGNVVTGTAEQTQTALDMGALGVICAIMESTQERGILKECCWAVSNITAGTADQIGQVLESGIAPLLLNLMEDGEFEVRKEVTWSVTNAISGGTDEQIKFLMNKGFLSAMVDLLWSRDQKVVSLCLEALERVLRVGDDIMHNATAQANPYAVALESNGGLEALGALQEHKNKKICNLASSLLDMYFEGEEENPFAEGEGSSQPSQLTFDFTESGEKFSF